MTPTWLALLLAFAAAFAAALAASFLSAAWRRRIKPSPEAARLEACLPGLDCGFCGQESCRAYAAALDERGADPALCAPGGARVEESLRALLAERAGDPRASRRVAVIRCGGDAGKNAKAFEYDNREDCASAAALYGGPRNCKEGCLGFGSCLPACPLGAISVRGGLALIDAERCSGCGACVDSCPKGLIALLPAEQAWYVACAARSEPERRAKACKAACDACGECARRSVLGEFKITEGLAKVSRIEDPLGAEIAAHCPSGAIRPTSPKKKDATPIEKTDPRL